ncbi:PCP degradation transcriptional activation protein [Paraburkholderia caffeinitolerans]|uniref:PCP degradation transcriptional activation protein n=1 Tax=Paraburkholderia caffeinitolerans TaxID=1723730 RepID=A0A6J5G2A9_9BURK|nr:MULTISPECIES: LysR family transcriptional regulator [Paraburkholderia]CAB3788534.1 PCP degradation transcriptional activation protein [Paraburkholderia caffeinitolerans]
MNLNTMDLNLLVVFDALLRTRSTTLAAQELHLTQSAISNALKRLRTAFDDPLFVKSARGMVPTAYALDMARPVLDGLNLIRSAVTSRASFDPAASDRTFRIYVNELGQMVAMPRLLAALAEEAPGVKLMTVDLAPGEAQAAMEAGELDVAFGQLIGFRSGFQHQHLFSERYVALLSQSHRHIQGQLTLRDFFDANHIVYRPSVGSHAVFEDTVDRLFEAHGERRKVAVRLAYSLGIAAMIEATDLLVCVPSLLASALAQAGNLQILPLPFESPVFHISLLWHERSDADGGHQWLRTLFRRLFESGVARGA